MTNIATYYSIIVNTIKYASANGADERGRAKGPFFGSKQKKCDNGGRYMFGTNGFSFALSIFKNQFLELELKEETKRKVLRENAIRVFKL